MPEQAASGGWGWDCGWPAPAKVNLFLHIVGRRSDGYHLLQTLFQFVDTGDALHFRLRDDGRIGRSQALPGVAPEADLAIRAARALQTATGCTLGVDIALTKHLPLGGGLGGGSSDAATVLVALNHLWGAGLDLEALARLGVRLGADVPVFVAGHSAWAEGIGERLSPLVVSEPWYLLIVPGVSVATADVFSAAELTRDRPRTTIRDFLAGRAVNDCEPVVRRRYPAVGEALDWLRAHGLQARLSGTGAAVFAPCPDEATARRLRGTLPETWQGIVARGRNRSPLAYRLPGTGGVSDEATNIGP